MERDDESLLEAVAEDYINTLLPKVVKIYRLRCGLPISRSTPPESVVTVPVDVVEVEDYDLEEIANLAASDYLKALTFKMSKIGADEQEVSSLLSP